jgi:Ferredoxin-like domain in Api92-like protein
MPNWCYQNLYITGDYNERTRLIESVRTEQGHQLTELHPCPQELRDTTSGWFSDPEEQLKLQVQQQRNIAKYGYKDWYDWGYSEWDTKWGDCDTQLEDHNDTETHFRYNSAWSPAVALISKISEKFPTLVFGLSYTEEANQFAGWTVLRNGLVVDSYDADIPPCPDSDELDQVEFDEAYDKWNDSINDMAEDGLFDCMGAVAA